MKPRRKRLSILLASLVTGLCWQAAASAQEGLVWRKVEPANLVFLQLGEGEVVIELNPAFAPLTVKQFRELVSDDFYRALSFYRVIDGFVAQAGDESDLEGNPSAPALPAEFEREFDASELAWTSVQKRDFYAPETGFIDGFAAARDEDRTWLVHCPGAVAMARDNDPDSGSTDFYIVIGQAPRYLDRNLTIFGRVIHGMDVVQRIRRGPIEANGIIADDTARSRISRARLGDAPGQEAQQDYYVMDTKGDGFEAYLKSRRNRSDAFFHHQPPRVLDVCQVPIATQVEKPPSPGMKLLNSKPQAAEAGSE